MRTSLKKKIKRERDRDEHNNPKYIRRKKKE